MLSNWSVNGRTESPGKVTGFKFESYSFSYTNPKVTNIIVHHLPNVLSTVQALWTYFLYYTLFYKNTVFPIQAEYSNFSADFRLKLLLWTFLENTVWHFRFSKYWVINYKCLVSRSVSCYIVHMYHCFLLQPGRFGFKQSIPYRNQVTEMKTPDFVPTNNIGKR